MKSVPKTLCKFVKKPAPPEADVVPLSWTLLLWSCLMWQGDTTQAEDGLDCDTPVSWRAEAPVVPGTGQCRISLCPRCLCCPHFFIFSPRSVVAVYHGDSMPLDATELLGIWTGFACLPEASDTWSPPRSTVNIAPSGGRHRGARAYRRSRLQPRGLGRLIGNVERFCQAHMVTACSVNVVRRGQEGLHNLVMPAGTAEPLQVSPPEAVAYPLEVTAQPFGRAVRQSAQYYGRMSTEAT